MNLKNSINEYWKNLKKIGVKFKDKKSFEIFLFDYACDSLDYNKKEKTEKNIEILIENKVKQLYLLTDFIQTKYKRVLTIPTPENGLIKRIIKYEKEYHSDGLIAHLDIGDLE